jgi:ketosteroid isomerase-like protein
MIGRRVALCLWLTLVAAACASTSLSDYTPKDQTEAQIVASLMRIPNGIKARSVDLILTPYAEDVYIGHFQNYLGVAGPGAPLSISKADLRDVYDQLFRAAKDISMDVKDFHLQVRGDRAVAEAKTELLFQQEARRGEARSQVYRNEVTWRLRRTAGGWKIVEEIWE